MKVAIPVSTIGFHWEELVAACEEFAKAGVKYELFTPNGEPAKADPSTIVVRRLASIVGFGSPANIAPDSEFGQRMSHLLQGAKPIGSMSTADYSALYIPGGHGCLHDINACTELHAKILSFYNSKKILSAVCHATSTFSFVVHGQESIVKSKVLTGFPDLMDTLLVKLGLVPSQFLPLPMANDQMLIHSGAKNGLMNRSLALLWPTYTRVDLPFISGVGPKAARSVARKVIQQIK